MKKFLILIIFLLPLGCSNVFKSKQSFSDYNCPKVFFSSDENLFVDTIDNSNSLEDVFIKAELNNFTISNECKRNGELVIIPLDILIILKPMKSLMNRDVSIPMYVTLLDQNDNILETQYFMVLGTVKKNFETGAYIETDIINTLQVITDKLKISQAVVGFMLDESKRELLN